MRTLLSRSLFLYLLLLCFCVPSFGALPFFEGESETALFDHAKKSYDDGLYDIAIRQFSRFIKKYPASKNIDESRMLLGNSFLFVNKSNEAISCYELLLNSTRGLRERGIFSIAQAYTKNGDYIKALKYFDMLTDDFPDSKYRDTAFFMKGRCNYYLERYDLALECYMKIVADMKESDFAPDSFVEMSKIYFRLQQYEKGLVMLRLIKKESLQGVKFAGVFYWTGLFQKRLGHFAEAVDAFAEYLKLCPAGSAAATAWYNQGLCYLDMKKYGDARGAFDNVIKKFPKNALVKHANLGSITALNLEANYDGAIKAADKFLSENKNDSLAAKIFCLAGSAYLGKGDPAAAYKRYKAAVTNAREQDTITESYAGLGEASYRFGRYEDAVAAFKMVLAFEEDYAKKIETEIKIGDAYLLSGQFAESLNYYNDLLLREGGRMSKDYLARVYFQQGLLNYKLGRYEEAVNLFQRFKGSFSDNKYLPDALYMEGAAFFAMGKYPETISILTVLLKDGFENDFRDKAMFKIGNAQFNLKKYGDAVQIYSQLVSKCKDHDLVLKGMYELGWSLAMDGKNEDALKVFKNFIVKYPGAIEIPEVHFWIGEYYYNIGDFKNAKDVFERIVSSFPKNAVADNALFCASRCAYKSGDLRESVWCLKRLLEGYPDTSLKADVLFCMGDAFSAMRRFRPALRFFQKIVRDYPQSSVAPDAYGRIGDIYFALSKYNNALAAYKNVLKSNDNKLNAQATFKMGQCYYESGRKEPAIEEFLKVIYDFPGDSFWFSRAAYQTASYYEKKGDWVSAVNIYQKIVNNRADRYEETKEKIDKIKKDNWELFKQQ